MKRILFFLIVCCASALAQHTYYIAATGNDSNTAAMAQNKTTPWLHAPGMPAATSAAASYTPVAGDHFIFRGGDTWHYGAGSPLVGGTWGWSWSGTQANPIYIGVDQTWYSGASWRRPILTGDNPHSKTSVASCVHTSPTFFNATNRSYVTLDNFEWDGRCNNQNDPDYIWYGRSGPSDTTFGWVVSNNYFHGWTLVNTVAHDMSYAVHGYANQPGQNSLSTVTNNVIDGSDTYCNTGANDCSGGGFVYGDCTYVTNNVIMWIGNGAVCDNTLVFAGNLVVNIYQTLWGSNGTHGNVMEWNGYNPASPPAIIYVYNNNIHTLLTGITMDVRSDTEYAFNNVYYDNQWPGNCYLEETNSTTNVYHFNETIVAPCTFRLYQGMFRGTFHGQNLHYIDYTAFQVGGGGNIQNDVGGNATVVNDGSHVFQTSAVANGQGYRTTNDYAPDSAGDATVVAAGANLTARCNAMGYAPAAAACKAGFGGVSYNTTNHTAVIPTPLARPSSGAWNVGAYQFSAPNGPQLSLPTVVSYGNVNIGSNATQVVTLSNPGTTTANISTVSGLTGTDFSQTGTTCASTLAAGGTCTYTIRFTPTTTGTRTATFVVQDTGNSLTTQSSLSGQGLDPNAVTLLQTKMCASQSFPGGCTLDNPTTASSVIAVGYSSYNSAGSTPTMSTITDNATGGSNTYQQAPNARAINTAGGQTSWNDIWYSKTGRAGATTLTVTPSTSQTGYVYIWEFSNVANLDIAAHLDSQAATTSPATPYVTTTGTKEAIVALMHPSGSAAGANSIYAGNPFISDSMQDGFGWAHYMPPSPGSYRAQWSSDSTVYASAIVAFTSSGAVPSPDFTIAASPASATVVQGNNTISTITLAAQNGWASSVSLSALGLPTGVTASFAPTSCTPSCTSTLTLTVSGNATTGTVPVTVSGTGNGTTHTATFTLTVNPAQYTVTVTKSGTGTGTITSSPAGVNCGSTCSAIFNNGTSLTMSQSTADTFSGWAGTCGCTGTGACSFTLANSCTVTAAFSVPTCLTSFCESGYLAETGSWADTSTAELLASSYADLPINWVDNLEYIGKTSNVINFPASGTGGSWTCGATPYGPYTADNATSFQQSLTDAEACRAANNSGTQINIPATHVFSRGTGFTLPQTVGDTSTNFIVLTSTNPLPTGITPCSHGIQDNVPSSTQPGIRNIGCDGTRMSFQLGTTITPINYALDTLTTTGDQSFQLANGTNTSTSAYNDLSHFYTLECTSPSCNAISTGLDANGIAPHHYAILNGEFRPHGGPAGTIISYDAPIQLGTMTETSASQLATHIHVASSYIHGDMTDAHVSGGVATTGVNGSTSIGTGLAFSGCVYCSVAYTYFDQLLRPQNGLTNAEGHGIYLGYSGQIKLVHNWIEGQAIGIIDGGWVPAKSVLVTQVTGVDVEDRANRWTYPYSWLLARQAALCYNNQSCPDSANNYGRKNAHETKTAHRWLTDGNITENVDNSGGQSGIIMSFKGSNGGDNYWMRNDNITVTNNILRNGCQGGSWGYRSSEGDGGASLPTQQANWSNNLTYNIGVANPGCGGASALGFRVNTAIKLTWTSVNCTRTAAGVATCTLPAGTGRNQSTVNVGDPVTIAGCVDSSFNTDTSILNPALAGTIPTGLTVVYANTGVDASTTGCTFDYGVGWPRYLTYNHNSDFTLATTAISPIFTGPSANPTSPNPFAQDIAFTNSIFVGGGLSGSSMAEGNVSISREVDRASFVLHHNIFADRDARASCPGHGAGSGGIAACYTEYSDIHAAITPPFTLYGIPTANIGIVGNTAAILPDWHDYRLASTSPYSSGKSYAAADGRDLGANIPEIEAAQISTQYVCKTNCGSTGPYPDKP